MNLFNELINLLWISAGIFFLAGIIKIILKIRG